MKYTSSEANKLLKSIEARIEDIKSREVKSRSFHAASTEDPETLRPTYNFRETQEQLDSLEQNVRMVKHAINTFNLTHKIPGFEDMTIDQALIYLPQLSARVKKLQHMAAALPRERVESFRSTIIDYVIANYDISDVEKAYHAEQEKLSALQIALDTVNSSETMEIDIKLD